MKKNQHTFLILCCPYVDLLSPQIWRGSEEWQSDSLWFPHGLYSQVFFPTTFLETLPRLPTLLHSCNTQLKKKTKHCYTQRTLRQKNTHTVWNHSPPGLAVNSVLSKFDVCNILHAQLLSHAHKVCIRGPLEGWIVRERKTYSNQCSLKSLQVGVLKTKHTQGKFPIYSDSFLFTVPPFKFLTGVHLGFSSFDAPLPMALFLATFFS